MATLGMNDVKTGQKILINNDPCVITETEYVKPGKGQAFTRIKYRSIKSGRVVELTMKATDNVEQADVVDTDMQGAIRASGINSVSQLPRASLAPPDQPGWAIAWLCTPEASAMAGQEVDIRHDTFRRAAGLEPLA